MNTIPVIGYWVTHPSFPAAFMVVDHEQLADHICVVIENNTGRKSARAEDLKSAFRADQTVEEVSNTVLRASRGEGRIIDTRTLGGHEQVLVEFFESNERVWLPFQHLRRTKPRQVASQAAERFRLRVLAHALEHWNETTGALSHLDLDPLPHQIHLVHNILSSGNLNWLIADDVGLGKTIEMGMLLAAFRQRKMERILIVTPAGLTPQWQEELASKFGMDDFLVYNRDFVVNDPAHWPLYSRVIASIDTLKEEAHLESLRACGSWDVVVFDEAHRLSRHLSGNSYRVTGRYRLAQVLRGMTENLFLLSATPHQGDAHRFAALMELVRPEWKDELRSLDYSPELLRQCLYRNRKSEVTDANGQKIFNGQLTSAVVVPLGEPEHDFDQALQQYVQLGYKQAASSITQQGKAVGFVMTTFRKLAASSHAAIRSSLTRRLLTLEDTVLAKEEDYVDNDDSRFEGEQDEQALVKNFQPQTFFDGEKELLQGLISLTDELILDDKKLRAFRNDILGPVLQKNSAEKVLVFTEYRGTQRYLVEALTKEFGHDAVVVINGGMSVDEKRDAVRQFDNHAQFLVSTEAGGEGLNLHRQCHIMVNYDLPWNPMRLVQRVGRLYRYGQAKRVVVFNLHAPATADARIVESIYSRIDQVVQDLADVHKDFHQNLKAEIFGEFAGLIDVEDILKSASETSEESTSLRVDAAIESARQAQQLQREFMNTARGFDSNELADSLHLDLGHLQSFTLGTLAVLGADIGRTLHDGRVHEVLLPDTVANELNSQRRFRITFDRSLHGIGQARMMDFGDPLLKALILLAKKPNFGGTGAVADFKGGTFVAAILRWQDVFDRTMREEFVAVMVDDNGQAHINPRAASDWLATSLSESQGRVPSQIPTSALAILDKRLGERSTADLYPQQMWPIGIATNRTCE